MNRYITFALLFIGVLVVLLQSCSLPSGEGQGEQRQSPSAVGECMISPPPRTAGTVTVTVYLLCTDKMQAVQRNIPEAADTEKLLASTLEALLAGATEQERAAGLTSWFSSTTAGTLHSVTVNNGEAIIDFANFAGAVPNASTSAGSTSFLAQLNNTVFQFQEITTITYQFDGSCEVFWRWLQTNCQQVTRDKMTSLDFCKVGLAQGQVRLDFG